MDYKSVKGLYLGSIIKEGFYDKLIIIGFPSDYGARLSGVFGG